MDSFPSRSSLVGIKKTPKFLDLQGFSGFLTSKNGRGLIPTRQVVLFPKYIRFPDVKNRRAGGKEQIYAVQTNLDLNRWVHFGNLVPASTGKAVGSAACPPLV